MFINDYVNDGVYIERHCEWLTNKNGAPRGTIHYILHERKFIKMEINHVFIDTETTAKVIFYSVITAVAQSFKHYKDERHISVVYNAASRIQPIEDLDEDDYKIIEQARIDYFVQKNPGEKENIYPEEIIEFYVIKNND